LIDGPNFRFSRDALATGGTTEAKQDSWICVIFAFVMAIPIVIMYARLFKLYPSKDIFDIIFELFGRIAGFFVNLLFIFYFFQLGSVVMRNFSEFVQVTSLPETPQYFISVPMALVCIYTLKNGINTFGRATTFILPIIILALIATVLLTLKYMNIRNILPIFEHPVTHIFSGAFSLLAFPFLELVLFITVLPTVNSKCNSYKIYTTGLLIGFIIMLIGMVRNILVLGTTAMDAYYFSSYHVLEIVNIADFISRIEVIVAGNYLIAGSAKFLICFYATTRGFAKLFKIEDYKILLVPVAFLMVAFSKIYYNSTMEMFEFINVYKYYAPIFQIILPFIIYIFAEIKI
jgi:spore germination protein KB